jgi:hypothetical protein
MHISRRKLEKAAAGVPRGCSSGSDSLHWRERCASEVIASRKTIFETRCGEGKH